MFVFRIQVLFLTLDIKDAVIAVFGMFFGPLSALTVALVSAALEIVTDPQTGFYGFIMDVISSAAFSLPIAAIYHRKKRLWTAALGLFSSIVAVTCAMMLANYLITPFFMGASRQEVVALIPTLFLPFNLTKAILNAGLVLVLYKPISVAFRQAGITHNHDETAAAFKFQKKTVAVFAVGVALIVAAVLYFILKMNGTATFF